MPLSVLTGVLFVRPTTSLGPWIQLPHEPPKGHADDLQ